MRSVDIGSSRAHLLQSVKIFDDVARRQHSDEVVSRHDGHFIDSVPAHLFIAAHNSALGSILFSFSMGTMAWAAVVVVHEGRGISLMLCSVSNPTAWSPWSTRKHCLPCVRTS